MVASQYAFARHDRRRGPDFYPYAYMVGQSFKTRLEFAKDRTGLIPAQVQVDERLKHMRGEESALDWAALTGRFFTTSSTPCASAASIATWPTASSTPHS